MVASNPTTELCAAFSSPDAGAVPWSDALRSLAEAEIFWLSTVRPDNRPHVTPLLGVWTDSSFYFCTGAQERKARNLAVNASCTVTTGRNTLDGLDIVVEGESRIVEDRAERHATAGAFERKYRSHFTSPEGTWAGLGESMRGGHVLVYRMVPSVVFGFAMGAVYGQTRWTFADESTATTP
ncbi:MAG TPA: pyridoxamine 5'-phosphate oxidase family protein [Acidimicrobiales bacterium]|jgi:nitroimidazol reductase NimA-like FMN-containing flavoprotein (pyridoxamine 5'-phosphate oxidase superfamily)|nr:pyridoxamine 5'-phosphate oxidase family protein [Acidimicrobiales bacterium]